MNRLFSDMGHGFCFGRNAVAAICLAAWVSVGSAEEEQYRGLICRGVEEGTSLLIGQPDFGQDLISLFVTGPNPLGGTHTRKQNVAWVNDPLHSYVPDGTGALCIWSGHPDIDDPSPIFDLPGLAGIELLAGYKEGIYRDALWDKVLTGCYERGRPFLWGLAVDDTHSLDPDRINLFWYAARIPEMDEFALKKALREGASYVSSGPAIMDVAVEGKRISLKLDKKYDVLWLRDGQYVKDVGGGFTETLEGGGNHCLREDRQVEEASLDLGEFLKKDKGIRFVRAVVFADPNSAALTQPWRIHADGTVDNPYPSEGIWIRGQTHNHVNAPPGEDGSRLKAYRLAYQACGQLGSFSLDYGYREVPYQWLESDGTPQIESVAPTHVRRGEAVELSVKGVNFDEGCVVQLNEQVVLASRIEDRVLKVSVPGDLSSGKYDITVTNPEGFRGNRPAGLTVRNGDANTQGWKNFTIADGLAYPHNTCLAILGDEVWVGSVWGVSRYKNGRWEVFRDEIPGGVVYDIQPDAEGGLWMSSAYGMACRAPDGKWSVEQVGDPEGLSAPDALERWGCIALDKSNGSLWVANRWRGGMALRQDSQWKRLTIKDDGLPAENPSALAFDKDGVLWACFTQGLYRLADGKWQKVPLPGTLGSANYAFAFEPGADDSLWVSLTYKWNRSRGGGVVRFKGDDAIAFTPGNSPLPSHIIRDILVDRNGNAWFASDLGVAMLDKAGEWHAFTTLNSGLGCDIVQALAEDSEGRIWFATMEGVDCFNPY